MASIDFASLTAPVSESEPCGPDLDLEGDPDYMNFVARAEGLLPASFFGRDDEDRQTVFDRAKLEFGDQLRTFTKLLDVSRDIRLLTLLAKFLVLNRDLSGFSNCVAAIAALLEERWEDVHPRGDGGDFALRMVVLQSLDDPPTVILPLQHVPLATSRRFGTITYRSYMVATGEVKGPDGEEEAPDVSAVEAALMDVEIASLVRMRDDTKTLHDALTKIRAICVERVGYDEAVSFDRLAPLAAKMLAFLNTAVGRRDPTAKLAGVAAAGPGAAAATPEVAGGPKVVLGAVSVPPGSIASVAAAADALAAVAAYFSRFEPSSPAVLLVRQAKDLIGKSFLDVMRVLVPAHAEQAMIYFGSEQVFELPIERLSDLTSGSDGAAYEDGAAEDEQPTDEGAEAGGAENGADGSSSPRKLEVKARQDALALLDQVGVFYRVTEPSSPIPLLTERARSLAERDFLGLLKDVLPGVGVKPAEE